MQYTLPESIRQSESEAEAPKSLITIFIFALNDKNVNKDGENIKFVIYFVRHCGVTNYRVKLHDIPFSYSALALHSKR